MRYFINKQTRFSPIVTAKVLSQNLVQCVGQDIQPLPHQGGCKNPLFELSCKVWKKFIISQAFWLHSFSLLSLCLDSFTSKMSFCSLSLSLLHVLSEVSGRSGMHGAFSTAQMKGLRERDKRRGNKRILSLVLKHNNLKDLCSAPGRPKPLRLDFPASFCPRLFFP